MPVEMLTYADLAERLKISPEAARAIAKRHRFPRSRANDGKALVNVDLAEIQHKALPARSPGGHRLPQGKDRDIAGGDRAAGSFGGRSPGGLRTRARPRRSLDDGVAQGDS